MRTATTVLMMAMSAISCGTTAKKEETMTACVNAATALCEAACACNANCAWGKVVGSHVSAGSQDGCMQDMNFFCGDASMPTRCLDAYSGEQCVVDPTMDYLSISDDACNPACIFDSTHGGNDC